MGQWEDLAVLILRKLKHTCIGLVTVAAVVTGTLRAQDKPPTKQEAYQLLLDLTKLDLSNATIKLQDAQDALEKATSSGDDSTIRAAKTDLTRARNRFNQLTNRLNFLVNHPPSS
jgi:hypothetical protein